MEKWSIILLLALGACTTTGAIDCSKADIIKETASATIIAAENTISTVNSFCPIGSVTNGN